MQLDARQIESVSGPAAAGEAHTFAVPPTAKRGLRLVQRKQSQGRKG